MTHPQILNQFKEFFPDTMPFVATWFPNGKNSIRLRLVDGSEYVFTFKNSNVFRFETLDSFLEGVKGEKRM